MPYVENRHIVPYDINHQGLYLAAGRGPTIPQKVVVHYRPEHDLGPGHYDRNGRLIRREYNPWEDSSHSSSSGYSTTSYTRNPVHPVRGVFYNAIQGIRDRFYDNMYSDQYPPPPPQNVGRFRSKRQRERSWNSSVDSSDIDSDSSSIDSWDYTDSAKHSDYSSYSSSSSDTVLPQYIYERKKREYERRQRGRYVRERNFWERWLGW
ncbi:uncharacterized protein L201_007941 [Kwoniella dendrophila CBS 6074]|uniref:Uncharacterized protein n=1 Tax=Kwoniella dendrophila CBS 6074 TaxID=1295534 RepID=A0AAX4K5Y1_9TREE